MISPGFTEQHGQDGPAENRQYRPYRSKRLRPCDTCRRRKVACRIDSHPPCVNCSSSGIECSFEDPPLKRRREAPNQTDLPLTSGVSPSGNTPPVAPWNDVGIAVGPDGLVQEHAGWRDWGFSTSGNDQMNISPPQLPAWGGFGNQFAFEVPPASNGTLLQDLAGSEFLNSFNNQVQHSPIPEAPMASVRSLDKLDGFSSQYFGLSGESDPYLLRHFRFLSDGQTQFFKVHFRSLAVEGETGNSAQPPVQFMVSSDELGNAMKSETTFGNLSPPDSAHDRLENMVAPEEGRRLVGLFLRYVFPSLPIISRSELGIGKHKTFPSASALSKLPPHLLAAIYAISIQFCHYDPILCVSKVYTKPPTDQLWKLALQEIFREIHTPHLAVLQAILLYLQKPQVEMSGAVADSPFRWSFLSIAVSLSSTLGLHLDCRAWPIPEWEKRLRRRLWWAVYSESAWRSLLMGFPNHIHDDHWAVEELDKTDFLVDAHSPNDVDSPQDAPQLPPEADADMYRYDFVYLVRLACIASDIYWKFYTLKATSRLAKDLHSSLSVAKPLRTRLDEWYSALPEEYKLHQITTPSGSLGNGRRFVAYLRLSYLTLELFIYRALLRPIGHTVSPQQTSSLPRPTTQSLEEREDNMDPAIEATYIAAEGCASLIISYVSGLKSRDFNAFWFSWSRVCFSTVSNYAVTLLLQAPSSAHAETSKRLVDEWLETLRTHSPAFSQVRLGLLRLDVMHWVGLRNLSRASLWAEAVIQSHDEAQAAMDN
ncbi:fungal-specific transcription factor domain-containing protein [Aspergillus pseudoustus]|uniref:Fungal-specific transcription factor domain-containing protein n=1 Tax=Aspergillus pseudoustus TaxID=1810923 RepID=A0ABR4JA54_9EURO